MILSSAYVPMLNTDHLISTSIIEASQSWDGYERERAVRQLGLLPNPNCQAIAALLKRVNDWVPQVRAAAVQVLLNLLVHENVLSFVEALPDVYHLRNCHRDIHGAIISKIELFLLRVENRHYVLEGIKSSIKGVGRWCVYLSIDHQLATPCEIYLYSQKSHDIIVRTTAVRLLDKLSKQELELVIEDAILDAFMPVRREALLIALRCFPERSFALIHLMLSDRSPAIREIGVAYANDNGIDVEKFYIQTLTDIKAPQPRQLTVALLGLSEIGARSALDVVLSFLESHSPRVRKASIVALARLDQENAHYYLDIGLTDQAASVRKEAVRLMKKNRILLSEVELIELYRNSAGADRLQEIVLLNQYRPRWDRLSFLMWLLTQETLDASIARLDLEFRNWLAGTNYSFTPPQKSQETLIGDRLFALAKTLHHEQVIDYLRHFMEI